LEILSNRDAGAGPGGARPARILVADDNSNIQRMVSLALKEHGIEVIAVGNGEAAVRSMAQVKPDLILADVFMPVRSGYEVCEYVKNDSRFSHIPVVLLLGAFDPLDENEAKRVGADGVLKKPFVPPDPMVALVKALLEKSAPGRLEPVSVGAGPEAHPGPQQPVFRATRTAVETVAPSDESPEIDYPPMGRDAFDTDASVAVTSPAIQASAQAAIEDSEVMTQHRDAALGEPSFWHPTEPEAAPAGAAQTEDGDAADHDFAPVEPHAGYFDPPVVEEPAFSAQAAAPETVAQAEPAAHAEGEPHDEVQAVNWDWAETAAAPEAPASEESKADFSASPSDWLASAPAAVASEAAASPVGDAEADSDWAADSHAPMIELNSPGASKFAPSSAVWSEPEAASAPIESAAVESAPALADTQRISPETQEAAALAQEEDSFASESPAPAPVEAAEPASPSAIGGTTAGKPADDELVNAVVARVIAKLQPQIADMINEEILRPVVSALVRRELESK
jgi:CheY-like chemotaxis protein